MVRAETKSDGWRMRKAQMTHARIAEVAMQLFLEAGLEATTVDAIAAASDISRRTFFHYFESKEAVIDAWADELNDSVGRNIAAQPQKFSAWTATRKALSELAVRFETSEAMAIERLLTSTAALRLRKHGSYARQEQAVFAALTQKYPDRDKQTLRLIAMVAVGCLRVAMERWHADGHPPALPAYLDEAFGSVRASIAQ